MPLKFVMQTSRSGSSNIQYKSHDNGTFTPLMNKRLLSKLTTLSSVLTAAITWSLRYVTERYSRNMLYVDGLLGP